MAAPSSSISANHFMLTTHTPRDDEFKEYIRNYRIGSEVTFIRDIGKKYRIIEKHPRFERLFEGAIELHEYATAIFRQKMTDLSCQPDFIKKRVINNLNDLLGEDHGIAWYQSAKFSESEETSYSLASDFTPRISIRLLLCISRVESISCLYGSEGLNAFCEYMSSSRLISSAAEETACVTGGGGGGGGSRPSDVKDKSEYQEKSTLDAKPTQGKSVSLYSDVKRFEEGYSAFIDKLIGASKENIDLTKYRALKSQDLLVYLFPDFFIDSLSDKTTAELKAIQEENSEVFLFVKEILERSFASDKESLKISRLEAYVHFLQGVFERVSVEAEKKERFPGSRVYDLSVRDVIKIVKTYIPKENSFFRDICSQTTIHVGEGTITILRSGETCTEYDSRSRIHLALYYSARECRQWMDKNKARLHRATYFRFTGYKAEWFPYGFFTYFPNVRKLDIRTRTLNKFPKDTFNGLANLEKLIIRDIKLQTLPGGIFNGLRSLTELSLNNCDIESLPDGVFCELVNLKRLDLSQNKINKVSTLIFWGLVSLNRLDLSMNELKKIPDYFLLYLKSLQHLILKDNEEELKESINILTFEDAHGHFTYSI